MSQLEWVPGDKTPERQGYYETRLDTGGTAISLYSVLGWMPARAPGNMVSWRALPPAAEREEAERHIQELRAAQSHVPMDY
ncbi:hypothetical protein DDE05_03195 [Streptomyces cavourensis]|uniref:hypothetical protein n=1 Tax=unclassified Achromobacter TaxID=2626865 RepID=UPI000E06D3DB|nr:hypothetical protein DDE05_03195 [Streptomyces cavourensis]